MKNKEKGILKKEETKLLKLNNPNLYLHYQLPKHLRAIQIIHQLWDTLAYCQMIPNAVINIAYPRVPKRLGFQAGQIF